MIFMFRPTPIASSYKDLCNSKKWDRILVCMLNFRLQSNLEIKIDIELIFFFLKQYFRSLLLRANITVASRNILFFFEYKDLRFPMAFELHIIKVIIAFILFCKKIFFHAHQMLP